MRKLWWLLAVFAAATAIREGLDYFGPMARAYRAYCDQAEAEVRESRDDPKFASIEGHLIEVNYKLESAESEAEGSVRLVLLESVHFQKFSESGPFGNRRIAQTWQEVLMRPVEEGWVMSDRQEGATEVKELSAIAAETK